MTSSRNNVPHIISKQKLSGAMGRTAQIEEIARLMSDKGADRHGSIETIATLLNNDNKKGLKGLVGIEGFANYLQSVSSGCFTINGPEVIDYSYYGSYSRDIMHDGEVIGQRRFFYGKNPKISGRPLGLEYNGRIPGYNTGKEVTLVFADKRFVSQNYLEGPGYIESTPWQRQDGHTQVVFP